MKSFALTLTLMVTLLLLTVAEGTTYTPPTGGVYMWGWEAYGNPSSATVFEVSMGNQTINKSYKIALSPPISLAPRIRSSYADAETGRVALLYSSGSSCFLAVWKVDTNAGGDNKLAPFRNYSAPVGSPGCPSSGSSVSVLLDSSDVYTTYIHAYQDGGSQLVAVSGVVSSAAWRVVAKIGPGWGPSSIDPSGASSFVMVNTTLLSYTQSIVSMSLRGGDVSEVALDRATSGLNKLTSITFPPLFAPSTASPRGAAPGSVGSIVSVTPGTFSGDAWTYDRITGTNMRYGSYIFDWEHQTAYAGGPSWCDAYHVPDGGNPPAAVMVIQGSWNYGGVLPFTAS